MDITKIAAKLSMPAFRVITDEPHGIAVGFDPKQVMYGFNDSFPLDLMADDGGEHVFIHQDGKHVVIRQERQWPNPDPGYLEWAEPDQFVWRSQRDFISWINESGEELDDED